MEAISVGVITLNQLSDSDLPISVDILNFLKVISVISTEETVEKRADS